MAEKIKIGILGLVHDHVFLMNEINNFQAIDDVEVACAADVNEPLLKKVSNMGVKKTYKDYKEMLVKEKLDAVAVYAENSRHAEYTEAAAEKGLHVMVEKPMAANLQIAKKMVDAAKKYKVKLMINFPTIWIPPLRHAIKLALDGNIGHVFEVRFRAAHKGPKEEGCTPYFYNWLYDEKLNGAGAFMDFCCYGAMYSRWVLGVPEKVTAIGGNYVKDYIAPLEDNAILLMAYKRAMGIAEASWSQMPAEEGPLFSLLLRGSEGTIAASMGKGVKAWMKGGSWTDVKVPPLENGHRNAPEHFISCIREDKPFLPPVSAENNLQSQAALEAGLISMKKDRTVYMSEVL
ncbi:MAG: Gfo/Idh/MocA family oxidoreductase [Candidatus Bathyarchaeia archaeon]